MLHFKDKKWKRKDLRSRLRELYKVEAAKETGMRGVVDPGKEKVSRR
jgi:hypothetical protein